MKQYLSSMGTVVAGIGERGSDPRTGFVVPNRGSGSTSGMSGTRSRSLGYEPLQRHQTESRFQFTIANRNMRYCRFFETLRFTRSQTRPGIVVLPHRAADPKQVRAAAARLEPWALGGEAARSGRMRATRPKGCSAPWRTLGVQVPQPDRREML